MNLQDRYEALAGRVPYRALAAGAARWLQWQLIATPFARERLRAWAEMEGAARPAPDLRDAVKYYGDHDMLPAVLDAFGMMAPPARDFVLEHAVILGTGWNSRGWTSACPDIRARVIVLSGWSRDLATVRRTTLHECAHVWLERNLLVRPAPAVGEVDLMAAAVVEGWKDQLDRTVHQIESRAEALTNLWLQAAAEHGVRE